MMVGPLEGFADVWGSAFLKHVYGYTPSVASYLPSLIFVGMCFGAPLLSYIAEKTGFYITTIIGAAIVMALVFGLLVAGALTLNTITIYFVLVGICCAYQILAIYKASTYVPETLSGLTTAIANMIIMSFGYAFHSIIGYIVNINGGPDSTQALTYGVGVIPLTLCIGAIGFLAVGYLGRSRTSGLNQETAMEGVA